MLQEFGEEFGFGVTIADLLTDGRTVVSSTSIRAALSEGTDRKDAARMLGHWHRIDGPVEHGEKRGRELGYPTANMSIVGLHPPKHGVYAVLVEVLDGPLRRPLPGCRVDRSSTHVQRRVSEPRDLLVRL